MGGRSIMQGPSGSVEGWLGTPLAVDLQGGHLRSPAFTLLRRKQGGSWFPGDEGNAREE